MVVNRAKLTLTGVVWLAVLASAISVVYVTFDVRRHTHHLSELSKSMQELQVEAGQLLLEKSALAAYSRVERIATQEVGMRVPNGHEIVVVTLQ
jgi:cell division protein FtsL